MGGFNPVLSGLGRGAALAQLIRQQAIDEAREKRAAEAFEREKAIEEFAFVNQARKLGGRTPTGGDLFQRASGKMLTPKDRVEVDPATGRRTVIPGFGVAESDIKGRIIKSPGGQEFVLPTRAEMEAEQARLARAAFQQKVLEKQIFGDIEAETEGKKAGAKKSAEEPFAVAADERKGKMTAAEEAGRRKSKQLEDERKAREEKLERESRERIVAAQQAGANRRTADTNASRERVAAMRQEAQKSGANVDKEIEELDQIIAEMEAVDAAIADGQVEAANLKAVEIKQSQRLNRHNQLLGIIARKTKLAGGATGEESGTEKIARLKGKKGGSGPSEGLRILESLLK